MAKKKELTLVDIVKAKHGSNCFKDWGKKGGNPMLLKRKKK